MLVILSAAQADERQILVMGDSLSAAYNMPQEDSWVQLLQQRLEDQDLPWSVINASISGDTTRGGLSRLPRALEQHAPEVVIIALGGNDGLRGVNPAETERNLKRMVELANEAGATVLVAGLRIPPNYGQAYANRFEQTFRNVADETDAVLLPRLLDGVDEYPELFMDDGIHPTAEAQPTILDIVWPRLRPLLEE